VGQGPNWGCSAEEKETALVCGLVGPIVIVLGQVDIVLQHFPNVDSRPMYIQNDQIACELQSDF
jgi:hypothetical protein